MLLRKPVLLLFLLFCCAKGFAATFVVTSNADSGPGTLRDALTQAAANGAAEKDYITFNIADTSPTGRRINLITELPDLTSNLVIDGSTQPGAIIGESGAHIQIFTPISEDEFTLFKGSGLDDVEFYGLYLHDYTNPGVSAPDQGQRIAVSISNSSNIIFGSPGKGNLFFGFITSGIYLNNVNHATLQSNVIGLSSSNSFSDPENWYLGVGGVSFYECNNILIGGDTADMGNTIFTAFDIELAQKTTDNNITIKWNNFGVFQDGKTITYEFQDVTYLNLYTIGINNYLPDDNTLANCATGNIDIENNLAGVLGSGFIISTINGGINFYNNFFGVSRDGTVNLDEDSHADEGTPIVLANCRATINIGSNDPTKGNFLAYSTSTTYASNCPNVLVRNNQYECIGFSDIYGDPITIYGNDNYKGTLPTVSIDALNENNGQSVLTGTATPGALVDIFGSESCTYSQCSIRKLIETVTADANGAWKSDLLNFSGVFYASATKNNITSTFTTLTINIDKVVATSLRCSGPGTITGIQLPKGVTGHWVDNNGNIVSNDLVLVTNTPGDYQFVLGDGCIRSPFFHIVDNRPVLFDSFMTVTDPGCGTNNGSIDNFFAYDPLNMISSETWTDGNGKVVSTTAGKADNLPAGSYTYTLKTTDGCTYTYGPVVLKNVTGPNIDQSKQQIQATNCGQSTGSITDITATGTGTLKYIWWNSQQQTVGTNIDLTGQPAGTYKLEVTDDSPCGAVYTTDITIPEINGITMDESGAKPTPSSCGIASGSVTGIQVTGATQYKWRDANNNLISTKSTLTGVPAGTYTLTASNATGCDKVSQPYTVTALPPTVYPDYSYISNNTCPNSATGSITVTVDSLVTAFHWYDSQGNPKGFGNSIQSMPAGTYSLYLTDKNGCPSFYKNYTITNIVPVSIQNSSAQITNDQCNTKTGSITGLQVSGGIQPYTYSWKDDSGNIVSTSSDLNNVVAGLYFLTVSDASGCGPAIASFAVNNNNSALSAPSVSNIQICSSGSAMLAVNNASSTGVYNLYDSESSATPISQSTGGKFRVNVTGNTNFYITEVSGTCESGKTQVNVTVGLSALNIPNTFTPNGDGINDYWQINSIENYPQAEVQIFTRDGQEIYKSTGYSVPFDGTYKGKKLPAGVYYFIINLHSTCSLLSGSLTIIR